ncbi:phospholipase A [Desulfobotulus mexicanus]|uniref:Phosphatidylcholine 1-acylhydrolase n=1 Tax=Desulfobotulus mexicanus TaxID=2586642 RepID=A0A5S5MEX6_9BACT|nr:phospholipase A [Desulfobotulus mexicanus]TYT74272.1 phospholipase A [Desulfobotulus mexicanus]
MQNLKHLFFSFLLIWTITFSATADILPHNTEELNTAIPSPANVLDQRRKQEMKTTSNPFSITPHKPNYLLPFTWNSSPNGIFAEPGTDVEKSEVHFQLSLKTYIFRNFWDERGNLAFAYTNRSWWQAYNKNASSPFRETNHEPEVLLSYTLNQQMGSIRLSQLVLSLNHQSNGQSGIKSRSWNRIILNSIWTIGDNFVVAIRPWYRIPEDKKQYPDDPYGDDNPDIHHYLGYGDLRLAYKFGNDQNLSLLFRNNLRRNENKGAVQADWTFPLHEHLKLYLQFFNGYGESMLDYNTSVNRIGIGILLTDWL